MSLFRSPNEEPLWKDEFSVFTSDERYVTRRQFTKFLTLASLGMFVGNLWILLKSRFAKAPSFPTNEVAELKETPIRGVKTLHLPDFSGPLHHDPHRRRRIRRLQPEVHASVLRRLLFGEK
jgi:hypothetical protein